MALAVLVPLFALGAVVAIRRGARPMRAWSVALAMFAALSLSGWVAMETGEDQEERVEAIVPRSALHAHNEAATLFVALSAGVLLIAGVGVLSGKVGAAARITATVASVGLLVAGYRVGHSGGALVYTHGAGSAFVSAAGTAGHAGLSAASRSADAAVADDDEGDDDDDDDDENGSVRTTPAAVTSPAASASLKSHQAIPLPDTTGR
jgi:hypothetical protein